MSLQVLGVGLPRTGTVSLVKALNILGLRAIHYHPERLVDVAFRGSWRVYDDVDAAADFPAALAYRKILPLYPAARCILTIREPRQAWLDSVAGFGRQLNAWIGDEAYRTFVRRTAAAWWGSPEPHSMEQLTTRYERWVARVIRDVPADRLLVLNVCGGDGWGPLCRFLGLPVPAVPFPWKNKRAVR